MLFLLKETITFIATSTFHSLTYAFELFVDRVSICSRFAFTHTHRTHTYIHTHIHTPIHACTPALPHPCMRPNSHSHRNSIITGTQVAFGSGAVTSSHAKFPHYQRMMVKLAIEILFEGHSKDAAKGDKQFYYRNDDVQRIFSLFFPAPFLITATAFGNIMNVKKKGVLITDSDKKASYAMMCRQVKGGPGQYLGACLRPQFFHVVSGVEWFDIRHGLALLPRRITDYCQCLHRYFHKEYEATSAFETAKTAHYIPISNVALTVQDLRSKASCSSTHRHMMGVLFEPRTWIRMTNTEAFFGVSLPTGVSKLTASLSWRRNCYGDLPISLDVQVHCQRLVVTLGSKQFALDGSDGTQPGINIATSFPLPGDIRNRLVKESLDDDEEPTIDLKAHIAWFVVPLRLNPDSPNNRPKTKVSKTLVL